MMKIRMTVGVFVLMLATAGTSLAASPDGQLILVVIEDLLYPEVQTEVDRLVSDLQYEGYTSRITEWTIRGQTAEDLWNYLVTEYNTQGQTLLGTILLGNLPKAKNTINNQTTDTIYWHLDTFGAVAPRQIWASRISADASVQVQDIKRALDANHAYRTGTSRLPHTAHWAMLAYPDSVGGHYPNDGANALDVWPQVQQTHPAVAATIGGELIDETAHMSNHGLVRERTGRPNQARVNLLTSCGQAEAARLQVVSRGGGCVFSVGASATTYTGAFVTLQFGTADQDFRAHLAEGYSWGESLLYSHPFADRYRAMYWGDLSMPAMASPANQVPTVTAYSADATHGNVPLTVNFAVSANDPDGNVDQVEWFHEGYCEGKAEPPQATTSTSTQYTYTRAHRYLAEAQVVDNYLARAWSEGVKIAVGPEPGETLRINCGRVVRNTWCLSDSTLDYIDSTGQVWLHDQTFEADGTWGHEGGSGSRNASVSETQDPDLWRYYKVAATDRAITYRIPLPNGQYAIRMGFIEPEKTTQAGQRMIDVEIEDAPALLGYDPMAMAGQFRVPVEKTVIARVADGELTVKIARAVQSQLDAVVSLLEVRLDTSGNQVPVASIDADPISGPPSLEVTLDGSASIDLDGTIVSYDWDLGDGSAASGAVVSHSYTRAGRYRAVLSVTDSGGLTTRTAVNIVVTGLVAHWKFDESTGTAAFDSTGNGQDGVASDSTAWSTGPVGGALGYLADDARVVLDRSVDLHEQWTVAGWFTAPLPNTGNHHHFVAGPGDHVQVFVNRDMELGTTAGSGTSGCGFDMATLSDGWHHLAAAGYGTTTDFYINGLYVCSSAQKSEGEIATVGNGTKAAVFSDNVDDIRVYNYALTVAEVAVLADAGGDSSCGNGLVEAGETCDPPSSCQVSCDDGDPCTEETMTGHQQSCDVACIILPTTACVGGDSCCPSGCSSSTDNDCSLECGNSIIEGGETCDPAETCPSTCDDGDACTQDGMTGRAQTCDIVCTHEPLAECVSGDGCCPQGCNNTTDTDCFSVCGNSVIEAGETCDLPDSCPSTCDDQNACTVDTLTGSSQECNAACAHEPLEVCQDGDGCCPSGCDSLTDDDCSADCGNGVIDAGETCDLPDSCPIECDDGNACTNDFMVGSSQNCNVECGSTPVASCIDADGCCPPGCQSDNDSDCSSACGNGEIDDGETCDPPGSCPSACDDGDPCTSDLMTGSSLNCNAACSNTPIPDCSSDARASLDSCAASSGNDCTEPTDFALVAGSCAAGPSGLPTVSVLLALLLVRRRRRA